MTPIDIRRYLELPNEIKQIDRRIHSLAINSWGELNSEKLYAKLIRLIKQRAKLFIQYNTVAADIEKRIKEQDKLILKMKYQDHCSVQEIADTLGVAVRTVFRRLEILEGKTHDHDRRV